MIKEYATHGLLIKSWCEDLEDKAFEQAYNLAHLPFAFKHIALMPDCHMGYGMPIGGVLATTGDVVIPNAVGVDIGCGMIAVQTDIPNDYITRDHLLMIMGWLRERIPTGFKKHTPLESHKYSMPIVDKEDMPVTKKHYENAVLSLCTLGGGNHFIEIQSGDDGYIWIMVHSGSRNLGKQICDHYNKLAKSLNRLWYSEIDPKTDLAFLPLFTEEGRNYMNEMNYAVEFAHANRNAMLMEVILAFDTLTDRTINWEKPINVAHNYAAFENHFGKNVMVHRKGATRAYEGELGIIPGCQGTKSYIVRGKGNRDSFKSCSHGAGRCMGRKQAQRELNLVDEIKRLDDLKVIHGIRSTKDLDEAAGAYKDIETVMKNQADLVDIVTELTPLCVVKG
jgi:tRNA-splicing ligase RtcB (3'-phosphate/5'-hydroxy nucleic acid ligase)